MLITRLDYIEVPLVLKFLFLFLILRPIRYVGMSLSVAAFNNYTNCFCLDMFHTGFQALFNKVFKLLAASAKWLALIKDGPRGQFAPWKLAHVGQASLRPSCSRWRIPSAEACATRHGVQR